MSCCVLDRGWHLFYGAGVALAGLAIETGQFANNPYRKENMGVGLWR